MIQTLLRKWAYAVTYANSAHRQATLGPWLQHYNDVSCYPTSLCA
jgi:hypothetical protein